MPDWAWQTLPDVCTYRIFGGWLRCRFEQTNDQWPMNRPLAYWSVCPVMSLLLFLYVEGAFCLKLACSFPPLMAALHFTLHIPSSLSPTLMVRNLCCLFPSSQNPISVILTPCPPDVFSAFLYSSPPLLWSSLMDHLVLSHDSYLRKLSMLWHVIAVSCEL